jgi:hypothetical protein
VLTTWGYDATSRPTAIGAGLPGAAPAQRLDPGYDAATQRLTTVGGPGTESLAYDALGRVTSDSAGTVHVSRGRPGRYRDGRWAHGELRLRQRGVADWANGEWRDLTNTLRGRASRR